MAEAAHVSQSPLDDSSRLRVLIADDHAFFRRGIRDVVAEEDDMDVVGEAADGEEAVQLARRLGPQRLNLVLMDIDMPRLNGLEAMQQIRASEPDIAVVMLTASADDRDLFEAMRAGAAGFLSKNLSPSALVRALRDFRRYGSLPMSRTMASRVLAYFQEAVAASTDAPKLPPVSAEAVLTAREREVLEHIARGARDREIAEALVVTESTVKKHVQNILHKLHARNRADAVARLRRGLPRHQAG